MPSRWELSSHGGWMLSKLTSVNEPQHLKEKPKPHLVKVIIGCRQPKHLIQAFRSRFTSSSYAFLQGKWLTATNLRERRTLDKKHYKTLGACEQMIWKWTTTPTVRIKERTIKLIWIVFWIPFLLNKVLVHFAAFLYTTWWMKEHCCPSLHIFSFVQVHWKIHYMVNELNHGQYQVSHIQSISSLPTNTMMLLNIQWCYY